MANIHDLRMKNRPYVEDGIEYLFCCKCEVYKPASEYYTGRNYCKSCHNERTKQWRRDNSERDKQLASEGHRRRKYGTSPSHIQALRIVQDDRCAICKRTVEECGKRNDFMVDHNHETGKVRGLLCNSCNVALAFMQEDIVVLQRAIDYLKNDGFRP